MTLSLIASHSAICSGCLPCRHSWRRTRKAVVPCRIPLGEDQPYLEILPLVLTNYGTAVQCGTHHIFESLPRLLTLWFEFGSQQMSSRSTSVKVLSPLSRPRPCSAVDILQQCSHRFFCSPPVKLQTNWTGITSSLCPQSSSVMQYRSISDYRCSQAHPERLCVFPGLLYLARRADEQRDVFCMFCC